MARRAGQVSWGSWGSLAWGQPGGQVCEGQAVALTGAEVRLGCSGCRTGGKDISGEAAERPVHSEQGAQPGHSAPSSAPTIVGMQVTVESQGHCGEWRQGTLESAHGAAHPQASPEPAFTPPGQATCSPCRPAFSPRVLPT